MTSKSILANIIASYFFGRVIQPANVTSTDYGYEGRIDNAQRQIGVFFNGGKIYVEEYTEYDNGAYAEPDFIIHGDTSEAVADWVKGRKELDALF